MKTIGKHRPRSSPVGDTQAACDYCGVRWLRSQLRYDEGGRLVCPQEGPGHSEVALDRMVAEDAARPRAQIRPDGGGNYGTPPDMTHITDPDEAGL